jgi:hypothetical protein
MVMLAPAAPIAAEGLTTAALWLAGLASVAYGAYLIDKQLQDPQRRTKLDQNLNNTQTTLKKVQSGIAHADPDSARAAQADLGKAQAYLTKLQTGLAKNTSTLGQQYDTCLNVKCGRNKIGRSYREKRHSHRSRRC